jgi:hypothetical protein
MKMAERRSKQRGMNRIKIKTEEEWRKWRSKQKRNEENEDQSRTGMGRTKMKDGCLLSFAPCRLVEVYRRFRSACCLCIQAMSMKTAIFPHSELISLPLKSVFSFSVFSSLS